MSLFDCQDYREILRNELSRRIKQNPRYSQGAFARDLNLTASRLSEILHGKQGVSGPVALRIAKALRFSEEERSFFIDLVESRHGRSTLVRESARLRLQKYRQPKYAELLGDDAFHVISEWFHIAILELLRLPQSQREASWIADKLGISTLEAGQALLRLENLGLLSTPGGEQPKPLQELHQRFVGTVESEPFQKFSRQILWKAIEAVDEARAHAMHSYMLALPAMRLPQMLALIKESSNRLAEALDTAPGAKNVVYCLALQFFPVSQAVEEGPQSDLH